MCEEGHFTPTLLSHKRVLQDFGPGQDEGPHPLTQPLGQLLLLWGDKTSTPSSSFIPAMGWPFQGGLSDPQVNVFSPKSPFGERVWFFLQPPGAWLLAAGFWRAAVAAL